MSREPLGTRLKRRTHRAVGLAQDLLMIETYNTYRDAIFHGGTAIWRCYGGGRFSEDLDVYLPTASGKEAALLRSSARAKGLVEVKFKETENTVFAKFSFEGAVVSLEGAKRAPGGEVVIRPYEMLDGNRMLVKTLSAESLLAEKAAAYTARRKVRDLYDVLFLSGVLEQPGAARARVRTMLHTYRPPVDEEQLKAIVIVGAVPSAKGMVEELGRWERRST